MVEVSEIAPGASTKDEVDEQQHIWKFLVYGNPGVGKTHFGLSMPEPVCVIDTEGKSHSITDKFDKEVFVWDVDDYDEAKKALGEALDVLNAAYDGEIDGIDKGIRGSVVVDSMSLMWEWAQQKYVSMAYPGKSVDEVDFQSALQGGSQSDWKAIKRLHNKEFRDVMIDSGFFVCMTATSSEDYGEMIAGSMDDPPKKPDGEKNNVYKSTELLHLHENEEGVPVANLRRSGLTKLRFGRLNWPDYEKVRKLVREMEDAEKADEKISLDELERELNVDLFTGDPDIIYRTNE